MLKSVTEYKYPDFIYESVVNQVDPQELAIYNKVAKKLGLVDLVINLKAKKQLSVKKTIKKSKSPSKGVLSSLFEQISLFFRWLL